MITLEPDNKIYRDFIAYVGAAEQHHSRGWKPVSLEGEWQDKLSPMTPAQEAAIEKIRCGEWAIQVDEAGGIALVVFSVEEQNRGKEREAREEEGGERGAAADDAAARRD